MISVLTNAKCLLYWVLLKKWENNINICGIIREIEIEIQIEVDREKDIQNINLCKIMYTQQDSELIFTDSRVNNIGIWGVSWGGGKSAG